jgi:hypothetical protein
MSEARAGEHADPRRRNFLSAAAAGHHRALPAARAGEAAAHSAGRFEFQEDTLRSLGERMARGELTAERLVETYLARIGELDRGGPGLRAVLTLNPDALAIAATLDRERARRTRTRAAARHSAAAEGQHRYGRPHGDHGRIARPPGRALQGDAPLVRRCARRAPCSWERATSRSGPTSARRIR